MRKVLLLTGISLCMVPAFLAGADTGSKLGDVSDGSRAVSVHLMELLDEQGQKITPDDEHPQPFSNSQSCGVCHSYDIISKGWHFNAVDSNIPPGRPGQPWIFVDAATCTQLPVSYRPWPGTFKPAQLGLTPWQFTLRFGRHTPGGGAGELQSDKPDEIIRQFVSGKLEINCLACHNASPGQDQAEYASQIARQNFRWAATGACEFASVTGSAVAQADTYDPLMSDAIAVKYQKSDFGYRNKVLFNVVREVPAKRCYFCHSNKDIDPGRPHKWMTEQDVHLAAGLTCVDCHLNGVEHDITRGYEGEASVSDNPLAQALTCEACHLGTESSLPESGRLGAPWTSHVGIPAIHFDKLSCTACHSGPWPAKSTYRTKTSRSHGLGLYDSSKSDDVLPHLIYPVFAKQAPISSAYMSELFLLRLNGKIAPHKLIWPCFWGVLKGQDVTPIDLEIVGQTAAGIIGREKLPPSGDWPKVTEQQVAEVLGLFASGESIEGKPVYICGGNLYQLGDTGELCEQENHPAARPYLWPIAHDVRPASQSLGVRACEDCHSTDSPFFFGKVEVDSPLADYQGSTKMMYEFENVDPVYMKVFAFSFIFRPWLKLVALTSSAVLAAVLLFYMLKALGCMLKVLARKC